VEPTENLTEQEAGSPLRTGAVFALLPFMLGLMIAGVVGFGPCGPAIKPSIRWVVIVLGIISLASPHRCGMGFLEIILGAPLGHSLDCRAVVDI
jgi:hypothetical protein